MYLLICRNIIPGGSDGSGSFAAYENQALEKISLTALAVRPQNIRPTPDIGFFRLDQLNKKIYNLSVTFKGKQTDTAQEQARDHDQSIKMKNRKHTYPFIHFFNKTSG